MFKEKNNKYLDTVIIGSGLSALNFIDEFSKKEKKIHVISPNFNEKLFDNKYEKIEFLPSQMYDKKIQAENYFFANQIEKSKNCKVLGSLNFGGLSNYWGLQVDNYINIKNQRLTKSINKKINSSFNDLLNKFKLIGTFQYNNKAYQNEFNIPAHFSNLLKKKYKNFKILRPIIAFNRNLKKRELSQIKENKDKLNSSNFLEISGLKNKIHFHNFYVEEIQKYGKKLKIICKNKKEMKIFIVKKVILAAGTIATTKIIMNYLKIKKEVSIKHHPRLIAVYLGRKKINTDLKFTPSLLQFIGKNNQNFFSADIRPGNSDITDSIISLSRLLLPFKFLINFFKQRLIFSNILLDPKFSDIYMKSMGKNFLIYTKKNNVYGELKKTNLKFFYFLLKQNLIFPFFKTHFPGIGSDFHYFGSIPINGKQKLSVNENCQLKNNKNIYVVDSSVFNFKTNKYPLGIVMANARRIGKLLSK